MYGLSPIDGSEQTRLPLLTLLVLESGITAAAFFLYKLFGESSSIKKSLLQSIGLFLLPFIILGGLVLLYLAYEWRTYEPPSFEHSISNYSPEPTFDNEKPETNWFPRESLEIKRIEYAGLQEPLLTPSTYNRYQYHLTVRNIHPKLNSHWPGFKITITNKKTKEVEDTINPMLLVDIPPQETKTATLSFYTPLRITDETTYDVSFEFDGGSVR